MASRQQLQIKNIYEDLYEGAKKWRGVIEY